MASGKVRFLHVVNGSIIGILNLRIRASEIIDVTYFWM